MKILANYMVMVQEDMVRLVATFAEVNDTLLRCYFLYVKQSISIKSGLMEQRERRNLGDIKETHVKKTFEN